MGAPRRGLAALLAVIAFAETATVVVLAGAPQWLASLLVPESELGVTWRQALAVPTARLAVGAFLTAGAAAAAAWGASRREGVAWVAAAVAVLAVADLWSANRHVNRTYVVGGARAAPDAEAVEVLEDPAFDPRREVVLPGESAPLPADFRGRSRILEFRADRVRLEAELSAPGYVVLVDAYDPGGRATVDGRPARLLRANLAFRAVPLDAGSHVVDLEYRPRSALLGVGLSASTLAVALALLLRGRTSG